MIRQEVLMLFVQGTKKILKNNLSKLIVYGSYARGDYKENSDIDVMILTPLSKEEIERIFAIFRFINPKAIIKIAGGRELLSDKGLGVFKSGANGAITGDMLTTKGISIDDDIKMINELGFEIKKI